MQEESYMAPGSISVARGHLDSAIAPAHYFATVQQTIYGRISISKK